MAMTESGELAALCRDHDVALLTVFGSVLRDDDPGDLDVAVRFCTRQPDVLALLDELARRTGGDHVDLMVLNDAGPVARERALVGCRVLHQSQPGEFANAQIAAIMERLDTAWLRALDLKLMSQ